MTRWFIMKMKEALCVALILLSLSVTPSTSADVLLEDYAVHYVVDMATGAVTHSLVGTYSAAIECTRPWSVRRLPIQIQGAEVDGSSAPSGGEDADGTTASGSGTRTLRYGVSLVQGTLRLVETVNGTTTRDDLYSCASWRLDTGPATSPTVGMVPVTFVAPVAGPGCAEGTKSGADFDAPTVTNPRQRTFSMLATDDAVCLTAFYSGMVPPQGSACPAPSGACVPFSGNVRTLAWRDEIVDGVQRYNLMVGGHVCSFLVVGGYCWNAPAASSGNWSGGVDEEHLSGMPKPVTPIWDPCTCQAKLKSIAFVNETSPDTPPAIGQWGAWVARAA